MTHVSEITEHGHPSQEAPKQSMLATGSTIVKTLANPGALRKMQTMDPDEERYVRPTREYELPEYREGMKHCISNEKYLRPTRWCNPREPLVIAMANELRAYELSDYEFAEAAYWFVKTKFTPEFLSLNSVSDSLKRGTGTCFHMNSVWVALCRAAGIKARYKSFTMVLPDEIMSVASSFGEAGEMTGDLFNRGFPEMEGEVCIDGTWTVGHVSMRPELLASNYLPITRFGEDAIGLTLLLAPGGTIKRFESVSLKFDILMKAIMWSAPAMMERANLMTTESRSMGRTIIEMAGGLEAYDRAARARASASL